MALSIATTSVVSQRTRHLDIRYHFVRDAIHKGVVAVYKVPSAMNIADMFTKALRNPRFLEISRMAMAGCSVALRYNTHSV